MLISLLLLLLPFIASAEIKIEGSLFFKNETNSLLKELPPNFFSKLDRPLQIVEDNNIPSFDSKLFCKKNSQFKLGETVVRRKGFDVFIHSQIINLAQENKAKINCLHGSFYKVFKATLLHELVHVKDHLENISSTLEFQGLIGSKRISQKWPGKILNENLDYSVDPYEFKNVREALATNVEYFYFDDEFSCRKPAISFFIHKYFGLKKSDVTCLINTKILLHSSFSEDNFKVVADLNPKKIFQVHFLYASESDQIMSRWGHSMFRIVVCAPWRKEVTKECLKDISHHVVLSYRALVGNQKLSYRKGLKGDYPSQIFITKFNEILQEYTKYEFRDLYSVPLNFNYVQIKQFINVTLERYWTYKSRYFFLTNNCGTETIKHLATVMSPEEINEVKGFTPKKIFENLFKIHQLYKMGIHDLINDGYLYQNLMSRYLSIHQLLKEKGIFYNQSFKRFLKKTNSFERQILYETYFTDQSLQNNERKELFEEILFLERYLISKFLYQNYALISTDLEVSRNLPLKPLFNGPWQLIHQKYGVPLENEFNFGFFEYEEILKLHEEKIHLEERYEFIKDHKLKEEVKDVIVLKNWLSKKLAQHVSEI